ncbi:MAG: hypothetical protein JNK38_28585 [Acidobacteria bacterium]|nr:hypothetical protein [Acidobacteriota bacterium]
MKKIVLMLVFALMATLSVAAQDKKAEGPKPDAKPAAALPTVDEILDKYVKACGGKEAIQKLTSRTAKGTFEIESMGISGGFQSFAKAPNKTATVIEIPGFGTVQQIFDGTKAWDSNPQTGLRELAGEELAAQKRDADFYQTINMKSHYSKMTVKSKEKVGTAEAYLVEAVPNEGSAEKLYFDTTTGLLIRTDSERDSPQGKMAIEAYMSDYKMVDGVNIPHTLKQVTPMFSMTIKMEEIKHNATVEDAKFNKPAN